MITNLLLILLALLLVAINGFFVAAEFALVKLRQTRIKAIAKTYGLPGRIVAKVHADIEAYLSACQVGITFASLGLGWIGEPAFAELLKPLLLMIGIESEKLLHGISFLVAFSTISFLHIVVGEQAPKYIAIRLPERVSIWIAIPLYAFYWGLFPAIWLLNRASIWTLKLTGLGSGHGHEAHYSADELKIILRASRNGDNFSRDEWNVLAHILDFGDLDVADLMRPLHEMVSLSSTQTRAENLETITRHRYSRYPWLDDAGEVCGLIHIKDLFLAEHQNRPVTEFDELLRPVAHIAPGLSATELFRRFRSGAPHFAIVGHKGQTPLGFITLDNLLGAMVGEIRDEFRQGRNDWTRMEDGTLIGKGSLPLFTLERALGIDIANDEVDSVGGLLMWKLGNLPGEGDRIAFDTFDVVVKKMNGPRIVLVRVYPKITPPMGEA